MKALKSVLVLALLLGPSLSHANTAETTKTNEVFSGLLGGQYASDAVSGILDNVPILKLLPLGLFSVEDEAERFLERESARYTRSLVRDQMQQVGIYGPLSISSPKAKGVKSSSKGSGKPKLHARLSSSRVGLTFLVRF